MNNKGFSTIEILIAFALLVLALSGIIIVVFGTDSLALDSRLNAEALFYAERELNSGRVVSEDNFTTYTGATSTDDGGRFTTKVTVTGLTPCKNLLESTTLWNPTALRDQQVSLSTIVASLTEFANLGDDCADEPQGSWKYPSSLASWDFNPGGIPATGIDVSDDYAYLISTDTIATSSDLWVIDISDAENLSDSDVKGTLNTDANPTAKKPFGINAIDVAGNYAYLARNASSSQLIVVDVSNKNNPKIVATRTLPGVGNFFPEGRTIFYYNERIYIGTYKTAGPEFHVYSVVAPTDPIWLGSLELTHNVHDIIVRDDIAYLATSDNDGELHMIDVSNPANMKHPDSTGMKFNAVGNSDGTALYLLGRKLYLGRAYSKNDSRFLVLDVTSPTSPTELGSDISPGADRLDLSNKTEVEGIIVAGHLAFIATGNQTLGLQIWDITDPTNMFSWPDCNANEYNHSEKATGIDFDGTYVYVTNQSQNALRVFWSNTAPVCS